VRTPEELSAAAPGSLPLWRPRPAREADSPASWQPKLVQASGRLKLSLTTTSLQPPRPVLRRRLPSIGRLPSYRPHPLEHRPLLSAAGERLKALAALAAQLLLRLQS